MMAMLRLNVPLVFMYGGSILPGRFKGKDVTIGDVFEGVGAHDVGNLSDEELHASPAQRTASRSAMLGLKPRSAARSGCYATATSSQSTPPPLLSIVLTAA